MVRKNRRLAGVALAALALTGTGASAEDRATMPDAATFRSPPAATRPDTLYFWMNGNVSRAGIDADLQAMRDVGLGGLMVFDGSNDIPKGPVDYLSPQWLDLMTHMIGKADALGLKVGMHNAPGWSSSGGPWITPAQSMQQIVWTETTIDGGQPVAQQLPRPYAKRGFYRDAAVLAFPASAGDESQYRDAIAAMTIGGADAPVAHLTDRDLDSWIEVGPDSPLVIRMKRPFPAQAVTLYGQKETPPFSATIEASDDGRSWRPVTKVNIGAERGIESPGTANFGAVTARYFRVTPTRQAKLAEALFYATPRIPDWDVKGEHDFAMEGVPEHAPADNLARYAIDPATIIDVTDKVDANGMLRWQAPAGRWTILRFGHTTTGKLNVSASDSGTGLEVDKFDRSAVDFQFDHTVGRVVAAAGPLAGKTFDKIEIDSYEAGLQNWTAQLPADFAKRNGYSMIPWLPALTGRVVGDLERSNRFLFDFRRTLADLMADNYYDRMQERANAAGLDFYMEGYGPGPLDELQVSGRAQVPMTEFWTRTPWTDNRSVKMVSSAAHVYGKPVIAAEAFTGEAETSRWSDYPYAMKALGDLMFSQGFNQIYFHRDAHQPNVNAVPGMTMGPWGINLDRTNTWFAEARPWLDMLARSQYMLRQGHYVADVLYFVGEDSPNEAEYVRPDVSPDTNPLIGRHFDPKMPPGYSYDLVNAEVLLKRARVEDGRVVLPNGASYRMLALPADIHAMTPDLVHRLRQMVEKGMVLLGPKPTYSLTLRDHGDDGAFRADSDALWGSGAMAERRMVGKGRVYGQGEIGAVLNDIGVGPDALCRTASPDGQVVWLHRALDQGDAYFVANRQRRFETVTCDFRVAGKAPELWNPESGGVTAPAIYDAKGGRTRVSFTLSPAGSTFVMFVKPAAGAGLQWAAHDGKRFADADAQPPAGAAAPADTFTLSIWAKPDIDLRLMPDESTTGHINETGKFYLVPARSGRDMHGKGTAVAGLAVGRNGAFVIERASPATVPAVLVSHQPISGWTHFALVYDHGTPTLFIDGKKAKTGLKSGRTVYAGGSDAPPPSGVTYFFEGNNTPLKTYHRALSPAEIAAIAAEGPPAPPISAAPAQLTVGNTGKLDVLAWQPGSYSLSNGDRFAIELPDPIPVEGAWHVAFQKDRGAPDAITLPKLESLSHNADRGVRYFSGTATYTRAIEVPGSALRKGRRVYLDLGRVEVLARVTVNGKDLGTVWKAPYRVDITGSVRAGTNRVSIAVTDLWPNRMIGDAQRPDPNTYVDSDWPIGERFAADGTKTTLMAKKIVALPAWYRDGKPKPEDGRVTFTPWKFFPADEPLLDSGLLGPVRIVFAEEKTLR
ncbi:MAG TPA: glycosyl hydrolase [Sphingomonas sp.]|nr:glycosyl hydrolase [Sphingomonas sp.]